MGHLGLPGAANERTGGLGREIVGPGNLEGSARFTEAEIDRWVERRLAPGWMAGAI